MNNDGLKDYVDSVQVSFGHGTDTLLKSKSPSLDVNDHIKEIIDGVHKLPKSVQLNGWVDIFYKGKRIFAGDGPRLSRESIRLIADIHAEIGQDIYCMCNDPK